MNLEIKEWMKAAAIAIKKKKNCILFMDINKKKK